jgi:hypothetical protein
MANNSELKDIKEKVTAERKIKVKLIIEGAKQLAQKNEAKVTGRDAAKRGS